MLLLNWMQIITIFKSQKISIYHMLLLNDDCHHIHEVEYCISIHHMLLLNSMKHNGLLFLVQISIHHMLLLN